MKIQNGEGKMRRRERERGERDFAVHISCAGLSMDQSRTLCLPDTV